MKLSVILPCYNSSKYLDVCLKSILNQTFMDFELIALDDGSNDNTFEILKSYNDDERLKIFKLEHKGAANARNFALKEAKGEYLLFLDSDDIYYPCMFEKMIEKADGADIIIVNSKKNNMKNGKTTLEHSYNYKKYLKNPNNIFLFKGWAWDKMFKRDFILSNNLKFQTLRTSNDLYFTYLALALSQKTIVINEDLIEHKESLKTSLSKKRDLSPYCFIRAAIKLQKELKKRNLYNEKDFKLWAKEFTFWHIKNLKKIKNKIGAFKLAKKSCLC